MDRDFEAYWSQNHKRLILNAPKKMRDDYLDSTKMNSVLDWFCFVVPIGVGITVQPLLHIQSEILSWAIVVVVVVILFVFMQILKPVIQRKRSTLQVVEQIKQYYYERYLKKGLDHLESWQE